MVSLIRDENTSGRSALSANTVDLQQDLMMISDLTTNDNTLEDLEQGLPDNYTVENDGGTIRFVEDSDPVNDPVEEIAAVEDCEEQKVISSMAVFSIPATESIKESWKESMKLCGNDICTHQCIEATATVPHFLSLEPTISGAALTNLQLFYIGAAIGGLSSSQIDWLKGHPSSANLGGIYAYLLSRNTASTPCYYKSSIIITGGIVRAYIADLTMYSTMGSLENFACIMEEYYDCIKADYIRADRAFNATKDLYNEFGAQCSNNCTGQIGFSANSSSSSATCICLAHDPCSALLSEEISSIMDAISLVCNPDSEIEATLDLAAFNACNNVNLDPVDAFYMELANEDFIIPLFTDARLNCIWESFNNINDDLFCSSYTNFLGETTINLYLQNSIEIEALATTQSLIGSEDFPNTISIFFNQNQLDGLCEVTVAAIFLHEGIHAEMHRQLNDPSLSPNNTAEIWNRWETELSDHDNMAMSYISQIIASLKALFGDRYSDEEYEAIAWIGLGNINGENVNTTAWDALSDDEQSSLTNIFETVNSNCENDTCNN